MSVTPGQTKGLKADAGHSDLAALIREPQNKRCADCRALDTQWASANLGLFVCLECSGVHRALGVHISKVRSITMDSWFPGQVARMRAVGNERGNARWEGRLDGKGKKLRPHAASQRAERESFIRAKYEQRRWVDPDAMSSSGSSSDDDDDDLGAAAAPAAAAEEDSAEPESWFEAPPAAAPAAAAAAPAPRSSRPAEEDALAAMMMGLDEDADAGFLEEEDEDEEGEEELLAMRGMQAEQDAMAAIMEADAAAPPAGFDAWLEDEPAPERAPERAPEPAPEPAPEISIHERRLLPVPPATEWLVAALQRIGRENLNSYNRKEGAKVDRTDVAKSRRAEQWQWASVGAYVKHESQICRVSIAQLNSARIKARVCLDGSTKGWLPLSECEVPTEAEIQADREARTAQIATWRAEAEVLVAATDYDSAVRLLSDALTVENEVLETDEGSPVCTRIREVRELAIIDPTCAHSFCR